jgi:anti-sigma factor RsiW
MSHEDRIDEISAFIDGELPPGEMKLMREHLESCTDCATEYETLLGVSRRVKEGFHRPRTPDPLRARIHDVVNGAAREPSPALRPRRRLPWGALVAAGLGIAVVSSAATFAIARRGGAPAPVADQVLASHLRSLMPGHLTDVTSNDTHNVKPWFNGRLDLSPSVPRLDSLGFPLAGGRLDYASGRPVAVVVYLRRQHVINVFSWPAGGAAGGSAKREMTDEKGYHLVHWRNGGTEYWVASDVGVADLTRFVDLFARAEGASKEP